MPSFLSRRAIARLVASASLFATGCVDDRATSAPPVDPLTDEVPDGTGPLNVARDVSRDYAASLAGDRLTDACAEAGIVALSYREANLPTEANRWQTTADSTCAALDARADALGDAISDTVGGALSGSE